MTWAERAACRPGADHGLPANAWTDEGADLETVTRRRLAGRVCARCPVRLECRQAGAGEPVGLWGGIWHTTADTDDQQRQDAA